MATDKTAVIGFPVDHSLSPVIHNHWINALGLNIKPYEKISVDPSTFNEQINNLKAKGYGGLNVTVPLKELAFNISSSTKRTFNCSQSALNDSTPNVEIRAMPNNQENIIAGFIITLSKRISINLKVSDVSEPISFVKW
jgi:hypothetical protein